MGVVVTASRFSSLDVIRLALADRLERRGLVDLAAAITPSRCAWIDPDDEPASADAAFLARALRVQWRAEG